jgi:hypothetical protein
MSIMMLIYRKEEREICSKKKFGFHEKFVLASELFLKNKETE